MSSWACLVTTAICLFCCSFAHAYGSIAKLILVKGDIKIIREANGKIVFAKRGDPLFAGDKVLSADRSLAKIKFIDNSLVTLGPDSKIIIDKFSQSRPGVIKLLHGQVRSLVTKKATQVNNEKLYVVTPNAAMGVRGTDFHVKYDDWNRVTSLLVVHGVVAFVDVPAPYNEVELLHSLLGHERAVEVERGQYSIIDDNGEIKAPGFFDPEVLKFIVINENPPKEPERDSLETRLANSKLAVERGELNSMILIKKDKERTARRKALMKN